MKRSMFIMGSLETLSGFLILCVTSILKELMPIVDLAQLCVDFIKNRDIIKSTFIWENSYMYPVSAAIFTERHQAADVAKLQRCQDILKENTGIFSNFRSKSKLPVISLMASASDPEGYLQNAIKVYELLKQYFFSSEYLTLASMVIAEITDPSQFDEIAARTRKIYDLMKEEHPFLTSGEDSVFAALLGLSPKSETQIVREMESCYRILKQEFFSRNAVQSLSHVLALCDGNSEEKCQRTLRLFHELKGRGYKYGTDYELATLGVLAMLPVDMGQTVEDVIEADRFLAQQRGYGILGVGRKQRLMHAGMMVANSYVDQNQGHTMDYAAIGGTISLIVAQQAAMCAAIAASSAAAANNN